MRDGKIVDFYDMKKKKSGNSNCSYYDKLPYLYPYLSDPKYEKSFPVRNPPKDDFEPMPVYFAWSWGLDLCLIYDWRLIHGFELIDPVDGEKIPKNVPMEGLIQSAIRNMKIIAQNDVAYRQFGDVLMVTTRNEDCIYNCSLLLTDIWKRFYCKFGEFDLMPAYRSHIFLVPGCRNEKGLREICAPLTVDPTNWFTDKLFHFNGENLFLLN